MQKCCRSGNFRCKNIFVVCANHENKNTKYVLPLPLPTNNQNIFVQTAKLEKYGYVLTSSEKKKTLKKLQLVNLAYTDYAWQ